MGVFAKIANCYKPSTIFAKHSIEMFGSVQNAPLERVKFEVSVVIIISIALSFDL